MLNPTVNQAYVLVRAAKKIEAAFARMSLQRVIASTTQAVLRCNGRVCFHTPKPKEYVN